ncbi:hypothetical protein ACEQ8H_005714 [Pleosporales sp. CAS-2024a]
MFKPTAPLQKSLRRLPLTTKQAGKEYYKGNGVGKLGTVTRYGNFAPDWSAIRTYVYPPAGTKNCELTPFVAQSTHKTRQTSQGFAVYPRKFTGEDYLRAWKVAGGHDVVSAGGANAYRNMPVPFEDRSAAKS